MKIKKYEYGTLYLNNYIFRLPIKMNQSHKHENEKKASRKLKILLKFKVYLCYCEQFKIKFERKKCQRVLLTFGFESSPIDGTPAKIVRASCMVSEYRRRTAPTRAIFLKKFFKKCSIHNFTKS